MRRCDWLESRASTSVRGANSGAGSLPPSGEIEGKRPNVSARSLSSGTCSRLPTRKAPPRDPAHCRDAEAHDGLAREGAQVLLGAEDGTPEGMVAEGRAIDQVLGHHRRLVVGARDLLDDDPALAVELRRVDLRAPDEVGEQVDRLVDHLGATGDVEGHEIVRRVRVEDRAHPLGGLVDLAIVVVLLAALEHQVLEEVGHAVLVGALGARTGVERDEDGGRSSARNLDAVDRETRGEGRRFDARHNLYLTNVLLQCRFQEGSEPFRTNYPPRTRWLQPKDMSGATESAQ